MMRPVPTLILAAVLCCAAAASAQNITEWSSESRLLLSYRVRPEALQRLLPPGWELAPSTSAATPGANLNVTMMERSVVLDPQGKPLKTGTSRYFVLGVPARNPQTGQSNTMIVGGISPEGEGAYGVYRQATTARLERTATAEGEGQPRVQETWQFVSTAGDRLDVRASFRRGAVSRARVESVLRSARTPTFQRTYRIDQAVDVLKSASGSERLEQITVEASGPLLGPLLDGSEQLLGVSSVPYYVREISVP